jgi:DNA segregation ATPase FtsK/SpoIIIE, S-DNA-T family
MRNDYVAGDQLAQIDNPDPFAVPVWRSPVHRTPDPVIWVVQLIRLVWRVLWFILTHPLLDAVAGLGVLVWLRILRSDWFTRLITVPVRDWWRLWFYRRRWRAAMTLAGLAPKYRGQGMLPLLGQVHRDGAADLVMVGMVTGQAPKDYADRSENLAHAFGARLCRSMAPGRAGSSWNASGPTPSPIRSPPCRSIPAYTWRHCRSAGARTAHRGCCGSSLRMC